MTKDEALNLAIEALNKLARLGNGDSYGNSDGNCIAIKTLKAIEEALERPAQERNFCSRCGKRASKDLNQIHTCTPPNN